jgi:hypothetical protein
MARRIAWSSTAIVVVLPLCTAMTTTASCGTTELLLDLPEADASDATADSAVLDTRDGATPIDSFVPRDTALDTRDAAKPDTFEAGIDTAPRPCPVAEPSPSGPCFVEGQSCGWNSACGGVDRGVCTAGAWTITNGPCPPPVPACPMPRPTPGTSCPSSTTVCVYGNACGGVSSARCEGGVWVIADFPCKPDCPPAAPVPGSACPVPPPKSATCGYTFGPSCSFACICWKDAWTCYGTPCPDPPVGSGLDGGVTG